MLMSERIRRQKYTKTFDSSNIFYELRFQLTIEYLKLLSNLCAFALYSPAPPRSPLL